MNTPIPENQQSKEDISPIAMVSDLAIDEEPISILSEDEAQALAQEPADSGWAHVSGVHLPEIDNGAALIASASLLRPQEIVAGLLHQGTKSLLAGPSKVGKTWLMLDLALSVATGTPFLQWPTTQGRVLFVNFEIHRTFFKDRLELVKQAKGLENLDHLDIWNLRGRTADFDVLVNEMLARIQATPYVLIILDPIYKAMIGRSENTSSGVGRLCRNLERLVEKTEAAVVYAHHFTKGNQARKTALDRMSGSGVFARDADTILTLTEHMEAGCYVVETTLRNLPPQEPFVVQWQFPLMVEQPDLDPAELKTSPTAMPPNDDHEYLLSLLEEKPLTSKEWQVKATQIAKATFYRWLKVLKATGRLTLDPENSTWSRIKPLAVCETDETDETRETSETSETSETIESSETSRSSPSPQN